MQVFHSIFSQMAYKLLMYIRPGSERSREREDAMERIDRKFIMKNRTGLHMRLAAEVSRIVHQFDAEIKIIKADAVASARSIFDLLILGVMHGDSVKLSAIGHDAKEALDVLHRFLTTYRDIEVGHTYCEECEPVSFVA